jgi:hypothetical protein
VCHEHEVLFDQDSQGPLALRVVPAVSPSLKVPFDQEMPWHSSAGQIIQQGTISPVGSEVVVKVLFWSTKIAGLRGFGGLIVDGASSALSHGQAVIGIGAFPNIGNSIAVPCSLLAPTPTVAAFSLEHAAACAIPVALAVLSIGPWPLLRAAETCMSVLLHFGPQESAGSDLVDPLKAAFAHLQPQAQVHVWTEPSSAGHKHDLIISSGHAPHLETHLRSHGRIFTCESLMGSIVRDPYSIGGALQLAMGTWPNAFKEGANAISISEFALPEKGMPVEHSAPMFDGRKAYILIGGVGGFGLRLALWMYQVCAFDPVTLTF